MIASGTIPQEKVISQSAVGADRAIGLRVRDKCHRNVIASSTIVLQRSTQRPVLLEITTLLPGSGQGS